MREHNTGLESQKWHGEKQRITSLFLPMEDQGGTKTNSDSKAKKATFTHMQLSWGIQYHMKLSVFP